MKNKIAKALVAVAACALLVCGFYFSRSSSDTYATTTDLQPVPGSITVHKQLSGDIWHIRCDYMDGTEFHAGGGLWKRDLISNPEGQLPREGHRSNKCGDAGNWIIWVGTNGLPYRMDEIKSGATGGTLPTVIYRPRYNLTTEEIINMSVDDTDLIWRYSQNFIDVMDWSEIEIGKRMYWTTASGGRIWYHTGIPYESTPTFVLFIDDAGYPIVAGGSVEINDLLPGIHEISEKPDAQYYLGEVTSDGNSVSQDGWTVNVIVNDNEDLHINWPNIVLTPKPTTSPKPPDPPVVTTPTPTPTVTPTPEPSPTATPEQTPTQTPEITMPPTPEITATPTPVTTSTPTPSPVITVSPSPTNTPTPTPTVRITSSPTPEMTPTATPATTWTPTPIITISPTPVVTVVPSPIVTATPTATVNNTPSPTNTPAATPSPTVTPTLSPTPEITATPVVTIAPMVTPTPTIEPTATPTVNPTATPTVEPTHSVIVDVPIPEIPGEYKQPKAPRGILEEIIEDYLTALGIQVMINHVGDAFD